ncbi:MAG: type III secretion system chaperone [Victivallales bacterium]|nr:type III secretion system chaperone [Victivallales bacterium]
MTGNLEKLAEMASGMWTEQAVSTDDIGFVLELGDVRMSFFAHDDLPGTAFCRAAVATLGGMKCPGGFAEEALAGNFFWSGTDGATLSYNEAENAFYLTDRFDDDAFSDDDAFEAYVAGFMRTVVDWRGRLAVYLPEPQDNAEEVR